MCSAHAVCTKSNDHCTCNQRKIYQSPACIYKAEKDLSITGMYIQSRDLSIAGMYIQSREIYQSPACIYKAEIYQSPACIYKAKKDLSITGKYIQSRQHLNKHVPSLRHWPRRRKSPFQYQGSVSPPVCYETIISLASNRHSIFSTES